MKPVREIFDELGIAYAVGGSVAGIAHGFTRYTMDIDVVAQFKKEHVETFVNQLSPQNYFVDEVMIDDAINHKSCFNIFDENTGFKIDIFVSKDRDWDKEMLSRRIKGHLGDDPEPAFEVESVEDYVLSKLSWYKQGRSISDRQWNDILAVLKVQILAIEVDYLEKWAKPLGVSELLEKALDEAGYNE